MDVYITLSDPPSKLFDINHQFAETVTKYIHSYPDRLLLPTRNNHGIYDIYINYWNENKHILPSQCSTDIDIILYELYHRQELTFCHFIELFIIILVYSRHPELSDYMCSLYNVESDDKNYHGMSLYKNINVNDNYVRLLLNYEIDQCKMYGLIPIVTFNGMYGINTLLYLHFNNIAAVGISVNPYPAHAGAIENDSYRTFRHDVDHNHDMVKNKSIYTSEYFVLRTIYYYIINNQNTITHVKSFILFMYHKKYEQYKRFSVDMKIFIRENPKIVKNYMSLEAIDEFYSFIDSLDFDMHHQQDEYEQLKNEFDDYTRKRMDDVLTEQTYQYGIMSVKERMDDIKKRVSE